MYLKPETSNAIPRIDFQKNMTLSFLTSQTYNKCMSKWYSSLVINSIVFTSVLIFLLVDTASDRQRFYRQVSTYSDWALEKFKSDFILTIFYLDFHASFKAEFSFVQLGGKL